MAVNNWTRDGSDSFWNTASNWSLGTVPAAGDEVLFNENGDATCIMNVAPPTLDSILATSLYLGDLEFDGAGLNANLSVAPATATNGIVLDIPGTVVMSDGTTTVTGGTFDNQDVGTFTRGTSTLVMAGTGTITVSASNDLAFLTVAAGANTSITENTDIRRTLTINGTVDVGSGKVFTAQQTSVVFGASGKVTGGIFRMQQLTAAQGLTFPAGAIIDGDQFIWQDNDADATLAPGDYAPTLFLVRNSAGTDMTFTASAGGYVFSGVVEYKTTGAGALTIDNSLATSVSCTDLTIDTNAALITITDGPTTDWFITDDVINQITGGGSFDWPAVTGATINFVGDNADQFIDIPSASTISDVFVTQTGLSTLILNDTLNCQSFTGESGALDLQGNELATTDNLDWQDGFEVIGLDFATVSAGGNFTCDDQAFITPDPWTLSVLGTAVASGQGSVENCDASGGTTIQALGWTDNGGNDNWLFALNAPVGGRENVFGMQTRNQTFGATKRNTTFRAQSRNQTFTVPGTR